MDADEETCVQLIERDVQPPDEQGLPHMVLARLAPDSAGPQLFLSVSGAGGVCECLNGDYVKVGTFRGKPKFQQLSGTSIIYHKSALGLSSGRWFINDKDASDSFCYWFVCDAGDDGPAVGQWRTAGNKDAETALTVSVSEQVCFKVLKLDFPHSKVQRIHENTQHGCNGEVETELVNTAFLELQDCSCRKCKDFCRRHLDGRMPHDAEAKVLLAQFGTLDESMPVFWCESAFNSTLTHTAVGIMTVLFAAAAIRQGPSYASLVLGTLLAYLSIDLWSTLNHMALDYGWFGTEGKMLVDLHHCSPLNYELLDWWQTLALSYVVIFPGTVLHILVCAVLRYKLGASIDDVMVTYCAAFWVLGLLGGFVHLASHRRNHGLLIPRWVRALQDLRIILPPEAHSAHHQGGFHINYATFSGVTHPISNLMIKVATRWGVLPPPNQVDELWQVRLERTKFAG